MKRLKVTVEGKSYDVEVEILDEGTEAVTPAPRRANSGGSSRVAAPVTQAAPKSAAPAAAAGNVLPSPLGAVVVSIDVNVGDSVAEGQQVVTLEAMKMNTIVTATTAGTVKAILVQAGDGVEEGQGLIELG